MDTPNHSPTLDAAKILPPKSAFTIWESHLPHKFGCSRDELRNLRVNCLNEDEHWTTIKRRIYLTPQAVDKLQALLNVAPSPDEKKTPLNSISEQFSAPQNPVVEARVIKPTINKNILIVALTEHFNGIYTSREHWLRVRVSHNKNYIPGMTVPVRQLSGDYYETTRPAPRQRGRW
jgi:hypothetical protein